jgi:hypothetical protein
MGLGKLNFLRRRRINSLMELNRDEFDYYFDLNNVKIGVKDFDLKGKSVSFYFQSVTVMYIKIHLRGAHYIFRA